MMKYKTIGIQKLHNRRVIVKKITEEKQDENVSDFLLQFKICEKINSEYVKRILEQKYATTTRTAAKMNHYLQQITVGLSEESTRALYEILKNYFEEEK